ncbi:MFS transporter [Glycomyces xiaoerkulensis]|uniref:MFS transporter n=1 Tax=Glycomyces xiaoerkulensis TaxID=2038139 RepID=UPI000C2603E0|nr:MFS transporter [Glycomyces xiaoerkulensis]
MPKRLLLAVLLIAQTMASMDGSIANIALPAIQRDLGATGATQQLILSAYLLALASLIVTGARLGDLAGHRRAFRWGLALFTAASLACGLAPDPVALVAARAVQGAGAALLIPQVFSLIQHHFQGAARRRAVGLYSMVLALGVALGQLLGGLLVSADLFGLSWRPVFLLNVPVGILLLAVIRRMPPAADAAGPVGRAPARRFDVPGTIALALGMGAFTAPLTLGRESGWPWWSWAALGASAALLAWFLRHQTRAKPPLLDLAVLRPPGMKPGLIACAVVMGCYAAFLFAFTLHVQDDLGWTPLAAGLAFLPYTIGFGTMSLTWARMPERAVRALPVAGPVVMAAVAAAVATGASPWALTPLLALAGAGHAAGYSPLIARLSDLVPPGRASALSALNSTGPLVAQTVAIAAMGGIFLAAGLVWALGATAVVLLAGAGCAAIAQRAGRSSAAAVGVSLGRWTVGLGRLRPGERRDDRGDQDCERHDRGQPQHQLERARPGVEDRVQDRRERGRGDGDRRDRAPDRADVGGAEQARCHARLDGAHGVAGGADGDAEPDRRQSGIDHRPPGDREREREHGAGQQEPGTAAVDQVAEQQRRRGAGDGLR